MLTLTAPKLRASYPYREKITLSYLILLVPVLSSGVMKEIASSSKTKSKIKLTGKRAFDASDFLDSAGMSRKVVEYRRAEKIYSHPFGNGAAAFSRQHVTAHQEDCVYWPSSRT
jgi:hypothetical protein